MKIRRGLAPGKGRAYRFGTRTKLLAGVAALSLSPAVTPVALSRPLPPASLLAASNPARLPFTNREPGHRIHPTSGGRELSFLPLTVQPSQPQSALAVNRFLVTDLKEKPPRLALNYIPSMVGRDDLFHRTLQQYGWIASGALLASLLAACAQAQRRNSADILESCPRQPFLLPPPPPERLGGSQPFSISSLQRLPYLQGGRELLPALDVQPQPRSAQKPTRRATPKGRTRRKTVRQQVATPPAAAQPQPNPQQQQAAMLGDLNQWLQKGIQTVIFGGGFLILLGLFPFTHGLQSSLVSLLSGLSFDLGLAVVATYALLRLQLSDRTLQTEK